MILVSASQTVELYLLKRIAKSKYICYNQATIVFQYAFRRSKKERLHDDTLFRTIAEDGKVLMDKISNEAQKVSRAEKKALKERN